MKQAAEMDISNRYKRSVRRERILSLLRSTKDHPTADWVYSRLKKEFSHLSLGTVYRNLNILNEQGLVRKLTFGSTFDRYDANLVSHSHLVCEKCGRVIDFEMPCSPDLDTRVEQQSGFHVTVKRIEFFGICPQCLEKIKINKGV